MLTNTLLLLLLLLLLITLHKGKSINSVSRSYGDMRIRHPIVVVVVVAVVVVPKASWCMLHQDHHVNLTRSNKDGIWSKQSWLKGLRAGLFYDSFQISVTIWSGLGGKSTQLGLGSEDTWPGLGNKNPESQSYDATKLLISLLQSWSWNNTNTEISDQIMLKRHAKCVITNIFVVWSTSVSAEESETQSHKMR